MVTSALYKIESIRMPERLYIGSTKNFDKRKSSHLRLLRKNEHPARKLQDHYNEFGEKDLRFLIIAGCERKYLLESEMFFIKAYLPYFNTMGIKYVASKKRRKHSISKMTPQLKRFKHSLPFGVISKTAKYFNVSAYTVSQVACGKKDNQEIYSHLITIARERSKEIRNIEKQLNNLNNGTV